MPRKPSANPMPQRARKTNPALNNCDTASRTKREIAAVQPVASSVKTAPTTIDGEALLNALPAEVREALLTNDEALKELEKVALKKVATNRMFLFQPYEKQKAFLAAGASFRERMFSAGNRLGKSETGAFEVACHATGIYPEWWQGKRFNGPVRIWVGGPGSKNVRDGAQSKLIGSVGQKGTGMIPADLIEDVTMARTLADVADMIKVKHASGGTSTISVLTYEMEREKWQSAAVEVVWLDEEPPADIYSEALTRTNDTDGIVFLTFTPLKGRSAVVKKFLPKPDSPDRWSITMSLDEVTHFSDEMKRKIVNQYDAHERDARTRGIPLLGSGAVFPVGVDDIAIAAFPIPSHWRSIGGLDLGWVNPAAVKLVHDPDADVVYVTDAIKLTRQTPAQQAMTLQAWGLLMPWAWPHDGNSKDRGSGEAYAELYRRGGLKMLPEHSTHESGGYSVEPGINAMIERMQTSRLKVFSHLKDWFDEFTNYHRKDGVIVKEDDHLLDATRVALMSLRYARAINFRPSGASKRRVIRGAVCGNVYA